MKRIFVMKEINQELDLDISSYPMDVRVKIRVKTNFGEISYMFCWPPRCEDELGNVIQGQYYSMINELYKAHENRGGKFMGDNGFGIWMKENGETIVNKPPFLCRNHQKRQS